MKTVMSILTIVAVLMMSSFTVNQQQQLNHQLENSDFKHFRVHREGKAGVTLNWGVASPDVMQFAIERSYDGEFFEELATVPANGSANYRYKDNNVFPGFIYYRVKASFSDGTEKYSTVESVRIVQRG